MLATALLIGLLVVNTITADDSPSATFSAMKLAATSFDWEQLLTNSTDSAAEALVSGEIAAATNAVQRQFPPGPKGESLRQSIRELFAKHVSDKFAIFNI